MSRKKVVQKKVVKKNEVFMTYSQSEHGGEICAGQENDPWPSHEDNYFEFDPETLSTKAGSWVETIEVDFVPEDYVGKDVYVVVVRYSSGDTFGNSNGHWHVEGAYTDKDKAFEVEAQINNEKYEGYKPWVGYFEGLEHVEIHEFKLDGSCHEKGPGTRFISH